jgi:hypothetical protein
MNDLKTGDVYSLQFDDSTDVVRSVQSAVIIRTV